MKLFSFWRRKKPALTSAPVKVPVRNKALEPWPPQTTPQSVPFGALDIRRHFYNEPNFQCYASFFAHWGGWISAGHCLTEAQQLLPPYAAGHLNVWPDGLDAALIGCTLPRDKPKPLKAGQRVIIKGFPAGARAMETRRGQVYIERGAGSGTWIAHIEQPDEPVVSGMSGGPVIDADTGEPVGIVITRNSPADLNNDRDPDESCDFISLRAVWEAISKMQNIS